MSVLADTGDPILDLAIGDAAIPVFVALFGLIGVYAGIVMVSQRRYRRATDVVAAADVPDSGLVWVTGTARPLDDVGTFTSPVRKQEGCLVSTVTFDSPSDHPGSTLDWMREAVEYDAVPFLVEDDTGTVHVDPRGRHVPHGGVNFFGRHDVETVVAPAGNPEELQTGSFTVFFDDLTGSKSDRPPTVGDDAERARSPGTLDDGPAGYAVSEWGFVESAIQAGDEVSVFGYARVDRDLGGWGESATVVGVPPFQKASAMVLADRPVPEVLDQYGSEAVLMLVGGVIFALAGYWML